VAAVLLIDSVQRVPCLQCFDTVGWAAGRASNLGTAVSWYSFKCPKVLHGSVPRYLGPFAAVANLPGRRTLRSGGNSRLIVPYVRRSTVGDRAFSVAGPRVWNTLPEETTTSQSLLTFRHQLKTWLLRKSYPDIII